MKNLTKCVIVAAGLLLAFFGTSGTSYASSVTGANPTAYAVAALGGQSNLGFSVTAAAPSAVAHLRSTATTPFQCSDAVTNDSGTVSYATGSPGELAQVGWSGGATATCSASMVAMSYQLFAIDPAGVSHSIAAGSCTGCTSLTATNVGYICVQNTQAGTDCSGDWQISNKVTYEAQAGSTWTGVSTNCTTAASVMTCAATIPAGTAQFFNLPALPFCSTTATAGLKEDSAIGGNGVAAVPACYKLPPSGDFPFLGIGAIDGNIRPYHFPGGAHTDDTKGLFYSSITDEDLAYIFEAGMMDQGPWSLNKDNYYEKTFPYSGVGERSVDYGGSLPSTQVTLVVAKFGDTIITMYPADS